MVAEDHECQVDPLRTPKRRSEVSGLPSLCVWGSVMIAESLPYQGYTAYRANLHQLLGIPQSASDLDIHVLIRHGFAATDLMSLVAGRVVSTSACSQIISLRALRCRAQRGQLLTIAESDRLFIFLHILSMAQVIFGHPDKARRWLDKPKVRFTGRTPLQMLKTLPGLGQVEEMLLQIADGYAL